MLLCLHGWGGSKESFTELREALKNTDIEILTPDLPGFGDEPEPDRPWTVDDYADWVLHWLNTNHRSLITDHQPFFLLGHSHGGRIAIKLLTDKSSIFPASPAGRNLQSSIPSHLFLCASAGIKRPRHIKRILGLILAKVGKSILTLPGLRALQPLAKKLLYKLVRVHDYEKASDIMRRTLINVSNEDLRPLLRMITVPTDIFWGEDDSMTPLKDGEIMAAEIPHATLHTYPSVRHRVHRDRAKEIAEVIGERLSQQRNLRMGDDH